MVNISASFMFISRTDVAQYRLGKLTPENVPGVLDAVLAIQSEPLGTSKRLLFPQHWRGRMGMTKDEQLQIDIQS